MTHAIIASATGTARIPTQGSCRPFVMTSIGSPFFLIEFLVSEWKMWVLQQIEQSGLGLWKFRPGYRQRD